MTRPMKLNDLLRGHGIEPSHVLMLRHSPKEQKRKTELQRLAARRPEVFNAYQQNQTPDCERKMKDAKYIASFIGYTKPVGTLFVGLYAVRGSRPLALEELRSIPEIKALKSSDMFAEEDSRPSSLWFELELMPNFYQWKGRLLFGWSPPYYGSGNWARWAH